MVLAAAGPATDESRSALEALCRTYWYPLYAYARRRNVTADEAGDVVQAFFAHLLEKDVLDAADPQRGRFRTFLLTVFERFLSRERERAGAQKRGGGRTFVSIDVSTGEERYRREPFHDLTPEKTYERRWALTLLEEVLGQLQREYAEKGKAPLFERLKVFLTGTGAGPRYAAIAAEMQTTEGAVKLAVHRLRCRYRELLREAVADTVSGPDEVQDELDRLLAAVRSGSP